MDLTQLAAEAADLARTLDLSGTVSAGSLRRRIRRDLKTVCRTRQVLWEKSASLSTLPPAAEWLLDNHYLALREGREVLRALHRGRPLRGTADGECLLVRCAKGFLSAEPALTPEALGAWLTGFQKARPLTERELSLLLPCLVAVLTEQLASLCRDPESLLSGSQDPKPLESVFTALRSLSTVAWGPVLEQASPLEQLLSGDPSGHYPDMDEATRRRYRQQVCRLARRYHMEETAAARKALDLAARSEGNRRHVGWWLYREPLGRRQRQPSGRLYVSVLVTLSLAGALGLLALTGSLWAAALLLLPVSDLVKNTLDFLLLRLVPPRPVPRMELPEGLPPEGRTLCVIVGLLSAPDSGRHLAALLERYRLANRDAGPQLRFGILADLPDSSTPLNEEGRSCVRAAREAVDGLNQKYGGGFYLFFRRPSFHPRDEHWMGWERKRGALLDLVRLLKERDTALEVVTGDRDALRGTRYVITLDSDTALNVGAARELAGAMLHPLNQPEIDRRRRIVTAGHALFQPRAAVDLEAANRSFFSRVFGGLGGVDPYGCAASDIYHDLFDQGTYTGKGIFQVDAFFTCLDRRFPDNAILSHDLLEGSYLRAGLLTEVELTDGCPYKVHSWFSRLHRWIRGDWQLLPWLGRRVPDGRGGRERNPLPLLARWKIADNLRRSLSPVFTLAALVLGLCLWGRVFAWAGAVAVLAAASNLLLSGAELAIRRSGGEHRRYHSTVIAGLSGAVVQTILQLILLPWQAWTSASAIVTALWRMYVSHRKLLAWVTAAQAEQGGDSLWANCRYAWFSLAAGLFVALFAVLRIGVLTGLVWMMAPVIAWRISLPDRERKKLPAPDQAFLLHEAALVWRFFDRYLRPEDHYLIPDNVQEQPGPGLARRTSPTNIGLSLLSVLAASDLDLLPWSRAEERIRHILGTMEHLETWNGHLYNWYDTASLQPLRPRYVSTVDSGNLRGCLIALAAGLREHDEHELAARADWLAAQMNCAPLYDPERRLFSIGYDVEAGRLTDGCYDLMASEARQTSFIAVARGEVPPRHWRRLGRMLLGDNDYSGMASWTGTMFEYFMPNLLLPCEPNSLMYESLSFCVYAQKRRGARTKAPWGISESGFYAFDPAMNYQYKAHGVQALGLKRGLDSDLVVAPYATFLALLLAPRSALRNLRRLRDLGLEGQYGLYEAADFTPSRLSGDRRFEIVRSYMAHHQGMILTAVDNTLRDGIMQQRFMADSEMAAFRELLQERVPVGTPVMRQGERDLPDALSRSRRRPAPTLARDGQGIHRLHPACHLLSNGNYTVLAMDNGCTVSRMGDMTLTRAEPGSYLAPSGISLFFQQSRSPDSPAPDVSLLTGLTPAPLYEPGRFSWSFWSGGASWNCEHPLESGTLSSRIRLTVPEGEAGERRQVELRWTGNGPLKGNLLLYLEPVLCPARDFEAHPAFSRLFLESTLREDGAVFRRRPRGTEESLAMAIVWEGTGVTACLDRGTAPGRGGLRALSALPDAPLRPGSGSDPCLLLRIPVQMQPGDRFLFPFAMAPGSDPGEAAARAHRILEDLAGPPAAAAPLLRRLSLSEGQALEAFALLADLEAIQPKSETRPPQSALWPYGISGDLPIAAAVLSDPEQQESAVLWCRWHQLLRHCGYTFDLVLLLEEGGDYRRPLHTALTGALQEMGAESALGARGGIHLTEAAAAPAVLAWSKVRLPRAPMEPESETLCPPAPVRLEPGPAPWHFAEDGAFILSASSRLPPVAWSMILCNASFGWLTDETGGGFLWGGGNSREGRLSPWRNDPLAVGGPEEIRISVSGRTFSPFADGDGLPCTFTCIPGLVRWEKQLPGARLLTEGFVPHNRDVRILTFQLSGASGSLSASMDGNEPVSCRLTADTPQSMVLDAQDGILRCTFPESVPDFRETLQWWQTRVSPIRFETPDGALNRYLSGWCLYQVTACRLMARTSQYQNGGAYGFRDQLQDSLSLLLTWPDRVREQLILAAGRQFEEGDVQHWWHPPHGAGVRTRISDDLLWLPYVLCRYCEATGDREILSEPVSWLTSPPLKEQEAERYETPQVTERKDRLYDHALAAIRCVIQRGAGPHGLAKMGGGDWNDGMNRVGLGGQGESVWLTWFLVRVLQDFSEICEGAGDTATAETLRAEADQYLAAAQGTWDGKWYLRGYYDNGTPLGTAKGRECVIDSIAQSFSALPRGTDKGRAEEAVRSALDRLVDREHRVIRLLDPPFSGQGTEDPGYIRGYPAGVRENGGQYTHAAVWLALGCYRLGLKEDGWEILSALLPETHPTEIYRAEPFVLAGDVSSAPGREGTAGWSWYTGAAGWYWQTAVGELLGLKIRNGKLMVSPALPDSWQGYRAEWDLPDGHLSIRVKRGEQPGRILDGNLVSAVQIRELSGTHILEVVTGGTA